MENKEENHLSFCSKCGEKLSPTSKFCPKCGASLVTSEPAVSHVRERRKRKESDAFGLVSAGLFFLLLGIVYLSVPNMYDAVQAFILDFSLVEVSEQPSILLPKPASNHPIVYGAFETFCFLYGSAQIAVLILRFAARSPVRQKTGTFSDIVSWMSTGYVASLLKTQAIGWFAFWAMLIIVAGASLLIRSLLDLALSEKV